MLYRIIRQLIGGNKIDVNGNRMGGSRGISFKYVQVEVTFDRNALNCYRNSGFRMMDGSGGTSIYIGIRHLVGEIRVSFETIRPVTHFSAINTGYTTKMFRPRVAPSIVPSRTTQPIRGFDQIELKIWFALICFMVGLPVSLSFVKGDKIAKSIRREMSLQIKPKHNVRVDLKERQETGTRARYPLELSNRTVCIHTRPHSE